MSQSHNYSSVLIVGASGDLGKRLANAFLKHSPNAKTFILVRKGSEHKIEDLKNKGAVPIEGDLNNLSIEELATLLTDIQVVVCSLFGLAGDFTVFDNQLKLLEAARIAKVKKFIPAMFGFNYDLLDIGDSVIVDKKKKILEALRNQNEVDYLIINNGLFYNYALDPNYLFKKEDNLIKYYGDLNTQVHATAPDDIATYTAQVALNPETKNTVLNITGELKTMRELAHLIYIGVSDSDDNHNKNLKFEQLGSANDFKRHLYEKLEQKNITETEEYGNVLVAQFAWVAISGKALPSKFEDISSMNPLSMEEYIR
ncbi:hypothetical protein ABK040_003283 [Willaertia magna]